MGCKLNFSETSAIARQFVENGFERVAFGRKLDVVLINTCSVTDNADKKCRHVVNQAKKKSKNAFIIFTGCYAQLKAEEILKIDGVKAVFGAKDKFDIFKLLKNFSKEAPAQIFRGDIKEVKEFIPSFSLEERARIF